MRSPAEVTSDSCRFRVLPKVFQQLFYLYHSSFVWQWSIWHALTARNDGGVSVGFYAGKGTSVTTGSVATGLILQGSTFTSFTHPKSVEGTQLTGINKYNSIVGWYFDSSKIAHGFKRYNNGGWVSLNYCFANSQLRLALPGVLLLRH